jgi:hypothetical protein
MAIFVTPMIIACCSALLNECLSTLPMADQRRFQCLPVEWHASFPSLTIRERLLIRLELNLIDRLERRSPASNRLTLNE